MKIVSLNINGFGGDGESFEEIKKNLIWREYGGNHSPEACKDALCRWDVKTDYKPILELVDEVDADVILFQEYYINSDVAARFEGEMKKRKYSSSVISRSNKPQPLYTVAFCRNVTQFPDMEQFYYDGRIFAFEYKDFIIINAHMPLNPKDNDKYKDNSRLSEWDEIRARKVENQWEEIVKYLNKRKDANVILIGDLNVYQRGTNQYKSFVRLFKPDIEMRDLWLEQGGKDNVITFKKAESRLDYALVTPGLFISHKYTMNMLPDSEEAFRNDWNISDHRMLVVNIEEV